MNAIAASRQQYGDVFFTSMGTGAAHSAEALVPLMLGILPVESVVDFGCGRGMWLRPFLAAGKQEVLGIDGDYVTADTLVVPPQLFLARDITRPVELERQFDLAICLEVGEHLPTQASGVLIDNLVRHSSMVLFSAAVPGQGGVDHINEQKLDFWRGLFAARNFVAFDPFRPMLRGRADVEPWYRYNALLYVHEDQIRHLPPAILASRLPADKAVPDVSSPAFKVRKAILRHLPRGAVTLMAETKHKLKVLAKAGR